MKRLLLPLLLLLPFLAPLTHAQSNPQTGHGAPTGVCVGPYTDTDTGNLYVCKTGQYTLAGGSSSSASQFSATSFGAVYDDATDNCTAFTALAAASNAYSGPGSPSVSFAPPAGNSGKAYKLTSCNVAFTVPTYVDGGGATIDCAGSTANCIQIGPSGLIAFSNAQLPRYVVQNFTMVGGASLTAAGIEVEPFISASKITGINFVNFGAGNATSGNCTNFAVKWDTPNNSLMFTNNHWWAFDATAGRCALSNPSDGGVGSNTGDFSHNSIEATAAPGFTTPCASVAMLEGGFQSVIAHNNIYGFGMLIRVQGNGVQGSKGTQIHHNQLDNASCAAKGVTSLIHWGGNGSAVTTGPLTIEGNIANNQSTQHLFSQAGDSTGGITGISIINNIATGGGSNNIFNGANPACTVTANTSTAGCNLSGNMSFAAIGASSNGWTIPPVQVAPASATTQAVNITNAAVYTPGISAYMRVICEVVLTQAATTSSTLPQCTVSYTDLDSNAAITKLVTPVWAATTPACAGSTTNTVGNACGGSVNIIAKQSAAITYSTINYASSGATPMQYAVRLRTEILY